MSEPEVDLKWLRGQLEWSQQIDHGDSLKLANQLLAMLDKLERYEKWFSDNASNLANHRIGGYYIEEC